MAMFEIYKNPRSKFAFRIKSPDGKVIFASERVYETKESCQRALESLKKDKSQLARELMSGMTPTKFELVPNAPVRLDECIIAEKTLDGKIILYEVIE